MVQIAASAAALIVGWMWFKVSFVARESAWWNSLWVVILWFLIGVAVGVKGRPRIVAIGIVILNGMSALLFLVLALGR